MSDPRSLLSALLIAAVLYSFGASLAHAGETATAAGRLGGAPVAVVPAPPSDPRAAKTYAVLSAHCAQCHQTGLTGASPPVGGIADILDLDAVVRDPGLVMPGVADGSRLFQVMLERHRPAVSLQVPATGTSGARSSTAPLVEAQTVAGPPGPTVADIEAVRDWLANARPEPQAACAAAPVLAQRRMQRALETHLWTLDDAAARRLRFVSLAQLSAACVAGSSIEAMRLLLQQALAAVVVEGTYGLVLAIDLDAFGWSSERWEQQAARDGVGALSQRLAGPTVTAKLASRLPVAGADWLAASLRFAEPAVPAAIAAMVDNPAFASLAAFRRRSVSLASAAVEAGEPPAALAARLSALEGVTQVLARQLMTGVIKRSQWDRLANLIRWDDPTEQAGRPSPAAGDANSIARADPATAALPPLPRIALWLDKSSFAVGDAIVIHAMGDRTCHLTVINVDARGSATVVFPNAFQLDNRMEAGKPLVLPGSGAPFTFRARERGRETLVAICDPAPAPPLAIEPDYERRRFTVLGNWQAYIFGAYAGTPPVLLEPVRQQPIRNGRRGSADAAPNVKPDAFRPAARAAVAYEIR